MSSPASAIEFGCNQPRYCLAKHVYACELFSGAIFLDLHSLKYFAVSKSALPLLPQLIRDWPSTSPHDSVPSSSNSSQDELARLLWARRLLSREPHSHSYDSDPPQPVHCCSPDWSLRASALAFLLMSIRVLKSYTRVRRAIHSKQLSSLLFRLSHHHRRHRRTLPTPTHILTIFAKVRVWLYTARGQCLVDSLVLCDVLREYGFPAHFYIGVDLKPFSAHAWVQIGTVVLDESVENVRRYTPILGI